MACDDALRFKCSSCNRGDSTYRAYSSQSPEGAASSNAVRKTARKGALAKKAKYTKEARKKWLLGTHTGKTP